MRGEHSFMSFKKVTANEVLFLVGNSLIISLSAAMQILSCCIMSLASVSTNRAV
jgi:hypothetical protein